MEFKVDNYNRNRDEEINLGERPKREFNSRGAVREKERKVKGGKPRGMLSSSQDLSGRV